MMIKRVAIILLCLFLVALVAYCLLGVFIECSIDKNRYGVLKDHGSLIAGLIGFFGVLILVLNQNKTTKEILDSNLQAIKKEAFEERKSNALDCALLMKANITLLSRSAIVGNKLDDSDGAIQKLQDILKGAYQISLFLNKSDENQPYSLIIEYVNLYSALLENPEAINGLPNFVIGKLNDSNGILGGYEQSISVNGVIYESLSDFISPYRYANKISIENSQAIAKYTQIYIRERIVPLIIQEVISK